MKNRREQSTAIDELTQARLRNQWVKSERERELKNIREVLRGAIGTLQLCATRLEDMGLLDKDNGKTAHTGSYCLNAAKMAEIADARLAGDIAEVEA